MKTSEWVRCKWPYNPEIKTLTWVMKVGRGKVYLRETEHWDYTCSFGANSDDSYSGCLYGADVKDLATAKRIVKAKVLERLRN